MKPRTILTNNKYYSNNNLTFAKSSAQPNTPNKKNEKLKIHIDKKLLLINTDIQELYKKYNKKKKDRLSRENSEQSLVNRINQLIDEEKKLRTQIEQELQQKNNRMNSMRYLHKHSATEGFDKFNLPSSHSEINFSKNLIKINNKKNNMDDITISTIKNNSMDPNNSNNSKSNVTNNICIIIHKTGNKSMDNDMNYKNNESKEDNNNKFFSFGEYQEEKNNNKNENGSKNKENNKNDIKPYKERNKSNIKFKIISKEFNKNRTVENDIKSKYRNNPISKIKNNESTEDKRYKTIISNNNNKHSHENSNIILNSLRQNTKKIEMIKKTNTIIYNNNDNNSEINIDKPPTPSFSKKNLLDTEESNLNTTRTKHLNDNQKLKNKNSKISSKKTLDSKQKKLVESNRELKNKKLKNNNTHKPKNRKKSQPERIQSTNKNFHELFYLIKNFRNVSLNSSKQTETNKNYNSYMDFKLSEKNRMSADKLKGIDNNELIICDSSPNIMMKEANNFNKELEQKKQMLGILFNSKENQRIKKKMQEEFPESPEQKLKNKNVNKKNLYNKKEYQSIMNKTCYLNSDNDTNYNDATPKIIYKNKYNNNYRTHINNRNFHTFKKTKFNIDNKIIDHKSGIMKKERNNFSTNCSCPNIYSNTSNYNKTSINKILNHDNKKMSNSNRNINGEYLTHNNSSVDMKKKSNNYISPKYSKTAKSNASKKVKIIFKYRKNSAKNINKIKNEHENDINEQNDFNNLNDSNSQNDFDNESDDFLKEIEKYEQQEREKLENNNKKKRKYNEDIIINTKSPPIVGYHAPAQQLDIIRRINKKIENYKKGIITRKPRKRFFSKNPEVEEKSAINSFSKKKNIKNNLFTKIDNNEEKRSNSFSSSNKTENNDGTLVHFKSTNKMRKNPLVSVNK